MKKILHNLIERVALRFGPGPNCEWVQERLPEFVEWELPAHQFNAICDHLKECQACAAEEERLDALSRERLGFNTPKAQVENDQACAAIMSRIREYEEDKAIHAVGRMPRLLRFAVVGLLGVIGISALAYLGHHMLNMSNPQKDQAVQIAGNTKPAPGKAPVAVHAVKEPAPSIAEGKTTTATTKSLAPLVDGDFDPETFMNPNDEYTEAMAKKKVEAMIPKTDAEWKAWARKEYPHILWFYDILRENFNYTGSWKTLLIGSGEIYRFDYPLSLEAPNCRASVAGLERAASFAGLQLYIVQEDGTFSTPSLDWLQFGEISFQVNIVPDGNPKNKIPLPVIRKLPKDYAYVIAPLPELVISVSKYVLLSCQFLASMGNEEFAESANGAKDALVELFQHKSTENKNNAWGAVGTERVQDLDKLFAIFSEVREKNPQEEKQRKK